MKKCFKDWSQSKCAGMYKCFLFFRILVWNSLYSMYDKSGMFKEWIIAHYPVYCNVGTMQWNMKSVLWYNTLATLLTKPRSYQPHVLWVYCQTRLISTCSAPENSWNLGILQVSSSNFTHSRDRIKKGAYQTERMLFACNKFRLSRDDIQIMSLKWDEVLWIWATTCDLHQCVILTSEDSDEPVQPPFKRKNSKWCFVSSLTRQAKALIRLRVCAGWAEALLVAHTKWLEISCHGSFDFACYMYTVGHYIS